MAYFIKIKLTRSGAFHPERREQSVPSERQQQRQDGDDHRSSPVTKRATRGGVTMGCGFVRRGGSRAPDVGLEELSWRVLGFAE